MTVISLLHCCIFVLCFFIFTIRLHMDILYALADINKVVAQVYHYAKQKKVWALHGEMGAGKTTFVHALCDYLQVTSAVGSPTYAIINEYSSAVEGNIYHMDWYRLNDEEEAMQAGVEDALYSGNLCIVEWPEKAEGLLPVDTFHLYIKYIDESVRLLSFT